MTKKLQLLALIILFSNMNYAQVGIGTTSPDGSAALDISANDKGFLMPRMTTVERTGIANPATSLTVFDTDTNTFWSYIASTWIEAQPGVGKFVDGLTPDIAFYDGKVGIGLNTFGDAHMLFVEGIKDTDETNTAVRINGTYNGTGTSTATYGSAAFARNNSSGTVDFAIGTQGIVESPNNGGTINNAAGSWEQLVNASSVGWGYGIVAEIYNNSGTMNTARGASINVYNRSGATMGTASLSSMYMENTGSITGDAFGLWIGGVSTGSVGGAAYALYIDTPYNNVTGNNFALYSANTADSFFNGNVGFGIEAPLQTVHISGAMRLQPQASAPTVGALGDLYVNTDGNLYFHDGNSWKAVLLGP